MGAPLRAEDLEGLRDAAGRGKWMWLTDAAALAGQHPRLFLRRLKRIQGLPVHRAVPPEHDGALLRKWHPDKRFGRYQVNLQALSRMLGTDQDRFPDTRVEELEARVEELERRLGALRQAYLEMRAALAGDLPRP